MKLGDGNTSRSLYMVFGPKVSLCLCTRTFASGWCFCMFLPCVCTVSWKLKSPHLHATTTITFRVLKIQIVNFLVHFPNVKPTLVHGLQSQEGSLTLKITPSPLSQRDTMWHHECFSFTFGCLGILCFSGLWKKVLAGSKQTSALAMAQYSS